MKVYVVCSQGTHQFCNVYTTRELAVLAIGDNTRDFVIFEEHVHTSLGYDCDCAAELDNVEEEN